MEHYLGHEHACQSVTGVANSAAPVLSPDDMANALASPTYRYRDPEKRRAYMRQLMRRKRQPNDGGTH